METAPRKGRGIKCGHAGGIGNNCTADGKESNLIGLKKEVQNKSKAVYTQCGILGWNLEGKTGEI